jgi:hypothetical protein
MRKYRTVAQAMEACQSHANKVTPAREEGLKPQEAHGSWSGSTPRNQETMSLVSATNQESNDSLSAKTGQLGRIPSSDVATPSGANTTEPLYRRVGGHPPYPLASKHSPVATDASISPETAILLDRYGDIMGVVDNHPAFKRAIQQWEVFPQALTEACKRHGLDTVLDAIRYTANYPAAKHKGRFLFAVLKNGKKAKR